MDESFSPTVFLYGMALILAVGKAFTLTIWRTLPKPRLGLRQEMLQAWKNRRLQKQAATNVVQPPRKEPTADDSSRSAEGAEAEPHATMPAPIDRRLISEPP
ncbi:hypothetical protein IC232_27445 [Microvirga sp. BT688]|uniref:hypothetical protein n=1 Tax=Microvirga sp. TaxID=1873136 RepID=UPI00168A2DF0|nr:hypothetical protein [Microvirga sp.]MBD2750398.1 hypothetical protein [Microvirga sp.]